MKTIRTAAVAVVLVASALSAFAQSKAFYKTTTEDIAVIANTISQTRSGDIVIQGNTDIKITDKTTKAVMETRGSKVVLKFAPSKSKTGDIPFDSLTSADISGPVTIIHTTIQPTGINKTTATADKATYSRADQTAHLTGGVRIVQDNPVYSKPAVMTSQTAMVNMDPNTGPDDTMVKVDTPGGVSVIEASPTATEYIYISATTISGSRNSSTLQGDAYLKRTDGLTNAVLEAKGTRIIMQSSPAAAKTDGIQFSSLQSAEITGPVTIINTTTQPAGINKTTATAESATYSGTDQIAHLTGGVKIVQEDPMFAKPAIITGETAMVNLNPNVGPDDVTVQVNTPDGVSRIEVTPTPKPKEENKTN